MAKRTPMRAIRAKCVECSGGSVYEPKHCEITDCALWEYRDGHRPKDGASDGINAHVGADAGRDVNEFEDMEVIA